MIIFTMAIKIIVVAFGLLALTLLFCLPIAMAICSEGTKSFLWMGLFYLMSAALMVIGYVIGD